MIIDEDASPHAKQFIGLSSSYQVLMSKLNTTLTAQQMYRLRTLISSTDFLKRVNSSGVDSPKPRASIKGTLEPKETVKGIQNMIRDVLGIKLSLEDTEVLVRHAQGKTMNPYKERATS